MARKIITALFTCPSADGEDLKNSLIEWFYGNDIGMDFHKINISELPDEPIID